VHVTIDAIHKHCFVKHNWKIQPKYILIFFFTYAPCCHYFSLKFSLKCSSFVSSHNSSSCIFVHSFPHITKPCPFSSVIPLDTPHVCPFFPPVSCMSVSWSLGLVIGLSCEGLFEIFVYEAVRSPAAIHPDLLFC